MAIWGSLSCAGDPAEQVGPLRACGHLRFGEWHSSQGAGETPTETPSLCDSKKSHGGRGGGGPETGREPHTRADSHEQGKCSGVRGFGDRQTPCAPAAPPFVRERPSSTRPSFASRVLLNSQPPQQSNRPSRASVVARAVHNLL